MNLKAQESTSYFNFFLILTNECCSCTTFFFDICILFKFSACNREIFCSCLASLEAISHWLQSIREHSRIFWRSPWPSETDWTSAHVFLARSHTAHVHQAPYAFCMPGEQLLFLVIVIMIYFCEQFTITCIENIIIVAAQAARPGKFKILLPVIDRSEAQVATYWNIVIHINDTVSINTSHGSSAKNLMQ